ncbi:MAG: hypothetical protein ABI591_28015 [Kofleriaceae bacterium]
MRLALGFVVLIAACGEASVDMSLLVPSEVPSFDMSCVTAVDLLVIPNGDTEPTIDIGQRTAGVSCVDLSTAPKNFAGLQTLLAGTFDVALPKAGLSGVEMRGRAGNCAEAPAEYTSVFYGGANYKPGDDQLRIKISRSISCDAHSTFAVHPVDMLKLFTTMTCADWTDTTATLQANDIRATNLLKPAIVVENGLDTKPMATPTVMIDSFSAAYPGTCAAMELHAAGSTGLSCINANQPTACASTNLEVAVLADTFTASADPALVKQFGAANFVGIWTSSAPAGPVSQATITVDDGEPATKIVYGDLSGSTFLPSGAASSTAGGLAIVYAPSVVGITVTAPGKAPRKLYIGASADQPSAQIAVVN